MDFHTFFTSLFTRATSGMRSWKDRRVVHFCVVFALALLVAIHYLLLGPWQNIPTLTLFKINGTHVTIAKPDTGVDPFEPVIYRIPKNFQEYDNPVIESLSVEPRCTEQSRWALLVHEPHGKVENESALFFFLLYLQHAYPSVFADMHVFQEGQPHAYDSSDPLFAPPRRSMDKIDIMVQDSSMAWKKEPHYSPLNTISNVAHSDERSKAVQNFLDKVGYKATNLDGRWAAAIPFHTPRAPHGALDLHEAMQNHLQTFIAKNSQTSQAQELLRRIQSLEPGDARLAEWLITEMHLPGAFAYKLYTEGRSATVSTTSTRNKTRFTVAIYGLEDYGLYFASCAAVRNCLGKDGFIPRFVPSWLDIQPYRDWVMAQSALQTLKRLSQQGKSVVPIITASVGIHYRTLLLSGFAMCS